MDCGPIGIDGQVDGNATTACNPDCFWSCAYVTVGPVSVRSSGIDVVELIDYSWRIQGHLDKAATL
jgi:hypothetical protein